MDEANVRLILSDSFGEQVATPFKEGTVETENEVNFEEHLGYLCDIWEYWLARKGWELQNWFLKYKENKMKKCMIMSVRAPSCISTLLKQFLNNQVECLSSLLKLEGGRMFQLTSWWNPFKNWYNSTMNWALIHKELKLHISMRYFQIQEDHWYCILPERWLKKQSRFKNSGILDTNQIICKNHKDHWQTFIAFQCCISIGW